MIDWDYSFNLAAMDIELNEAPKGLLFEVPS